MASARILTMSIAMSLCTAARTEGVHVAHPCAEDMPMGVDGVLGGLSAAQLVQPNAVTSVLAAANLAPAELRHLSPGEHAEIMELLRAGEITLGDRFRLRVLGEAAFFAATEE